MFMAIKNVSLQNLGNVLSTPFMTPKSRDLIRTGWKGHTDEFSAKLWEYNWPRTRDYTMAVIMLTIVIAASKANDVKVKAKERNDNGTKKANDSEMSLAKYIDQKVSRAKISKLFDEIVNIKKDSDSNNIANSISKEDKPQGGWFAKCFIALLMVTDNNREKAEKIFKKFVDQVKKMTAWKINKSYIENLTNTINTALKANIVTKYNVIPVLQENATKPLPTKSTDQEPHVSKQPTVRIDKFWKKLDDIKDIPETKKLEYFVLYRNYVFHDKPDDINDFMAIAKKEDSTSCKVLLVPENITYYLNFDQHNKDTLEDLKRLYDYEIQLFLNYRIPEWEKLFTDIFSKGSDTIFDKNNFSLFRGYVRENQKVSKVNSDPIKYLGDMKEQLNKYIERLERLMDDDDKQLNSKPWIPIQDTTCYKEWHKYQTVRFLPEEKTSDKISSYHYLPIATKTGKYVCHVLCVKQPTYKPEKTDSKEELQDQLDAITQEKKFVENISTIKTKREEDLTLLLVDKDDHSYTGDTYKPYCKIPDELCRKLDEQIANINQWLPTAN